MSRRIAFRAVSALASTGVLFVAGASMADASVQAHSVKAHAAATTTISVDAIDYKFKLSKTSLPKPGTVTFDIKNTGQVQHDLQINKKTSKMIAPGASTTLTVSFTKAGSYYYECTVPGHAALGMKGYFKVG
jgi:uncharacterized cupredoxin-like copper-binding protein